MAGRPLLAWTIEAALGSVRTDRVLLSTDDGEIAAAGREAGAEVPFFRDEALGGDEVHAVYPVLEMVNRLGEIEGEGPEVVLMLLPTAPLRRAGHIDEALEVMEASDSPAVVSVYRWDRYVTNLRYVRDGRLEPVVPAADHNVQRQDQEALFVVNGAIFGARVETLRTERSFHVPGAVAYVMGVEESVDINDSRDLELARQRLRDGS